MPTTIGSRVKMLRKALKLTQAEFGDRLSVSVDVIINIERERLARPEQKEPLYKLMCNEFNARYEWLMTGEGEMFNETQEEFFDKLAEQYGLGTYARKILDFYGSLEDEQKQVLEKFIYQAAMCVLEDNIAQARSGVVEAATNANNPDLLINATTAFHKAFPYVGVGNITAEELAEITGENVGAVDKTMKKHYLAAHSTTNKEHKIVEDDGSTIEKLSKIPPVTNKDDF